MFGLIRRGTVGGAPKSDQDPGVWDWQNWDRLNIGLVILRLILFGSDFELILFPKAIQI